MDLAQVETETIKPASPIPNDPDPAETVEWLESLDYVLEQTLDLDLAVGNELMDKQQEAREMALAAFAKAYGKAA